MGVTDPVDAAPGTIRGDLALSREEERRARLRQRRQRRRRDRPHSSGPRSLSNLVDFSLVLASRSPQRDLLLRQLGIPFRVVASTHREEVLAGEAMAHGRTQCRRQGGRGVRPRDALPPTNWSWAVDTIVVIDGRVLGKAADGARGAGVPWPAGRGVRHEVISGLCVRGAGRERLTRCAHGGHFSLTEYR